MGSGESHGFRRPERDFGKPQGYATECVRRHEARCDYRSIGIGAGNRGRTGGLKITNLALYQLSYPGLSSIVPAPGKKSKLESFRVASIGRKRPAYCFSNCNVHARPSTRVPVPVVPLKRASIL
jgi:hypothetical protein